MTPRRTDQSAIHTWLVLMKAHRTLTRHATRSIEALDMCLSDFAILEALLNGGMLSDEMLERLLGKDWQTAEDAEERLDALIQKIIDKLQAQGYLSGAPDLTREREQRDQPEEDPQNGEQRE